MRLSYREKTKHTCDITRQQAEQRRERKEGGVGCIRVRGKICPNNHDLLEQVVSSPVPEYVEAEASSVAALHAALSLRSTDQTEH